MMLRCSLLRSLCLLGAVVAVGTVIGRATAADWPRFRGPNGSGIAADANPTPVTWSDTENLQWSVDLPGRGVSSPIVVGDRVIVTSWTGTGADDLVRHLVCYDRATGRQLYDKSIEPVVQEDPYESMRRQSGYAAHTPASDGERIFAFFGVSGVYCFDMDGNEIWHKSAGTDFDERHWGTASSPMLYKDLVIVTAGPESHSLVAFRKSNGEEVWKYQSQQLDATWSTPVLVDLTDGKQELVLAVPGFVLGFDPATGKRLWSCEAAESNSTCASPIAHDGIVYVIGGRNGGGIAIRAGGRGDITDTPNVLWSGNQQARIGTALYRDGLLYWISSGVAQCVDAKTGEKVYQQRLKSPEDVAQTRPTVFHYVADEQPAASSNDEPSAESKASEHDRPRRGPGAGRGPGTGRGPGGFGRGFGRRGGGFGGGFMQQDYSSPVLADGKIYYARRNGEVYVLAVGREFKQLAVNKFKEEGEYSASPAIADGQIFLRSSNKLYCIASKNE